MDLNCISIHNRLYFLPVPITLPRLVGMGPSMLYGVLSMRAGRDGMCYPTLNRIAADLGVSHRTAARWLAILRARNLIRCDTVGQRTYFRFLDHASIRAALCPVRPMPAPRVAPTKRPEELSSFSASEVALYRELSASIPAPDSLVENQRKSSAKPVNARLRVVEKRAPAAVVFHKS